MAIYWSIVLAENGINRAVKSMKMKIGLKMRLKWPYLA